MEFLYGKSLRIFEQSETKDNRVSSRILVKAGNNFPKVGVTVVLGIARF